MQTLTYPIKHVHAHQVFKIEDLTLYGFLKSTSLNLKFINTTQMLPDWKGEESLVLIGVTGTALKKL